MKMPRIKWRYYQDDNNRYVAQILNAKNEVIDEMGASLTKEHITSVVTEYHPHNVCINDATGLVL